MYFLSCIQNIHMQREVQLNLLFIGKYIGHESSRKKLNKLIFLEVRNLHKFLLEFCLGWVSPSFTALPFTWSVGDFIIRPGFSPKV